MFHVLLLAKPTLTRFAFSVLVSQVTTIILPAPSLRSRMLSCTRVTSSLQPMTRPAFYAMLPPLNSDAPCLTDPWMVDPQGQRESRSLSSPRESILEIV